MSTEDKPQGKSATKNRPRKRMPWWRAWNGLPASPRWRMTAKRSNRSIPEVMGVALFLFDTASSAEDRGDVSGFNAEVCAAGLDMETTDVEKVVAAFEASGWIADGRIATWDDWQTAVSEDHTGAERQRRHREKKKREAEGVTPVTCDNRDVTQSHDRGEESRSDESRSEQIDSEDMGVEFTAPTADTRRAIGRFFDDHIRPAYPRSSRLLPWHPAREKFVEIVIGGIDPAEILAGVEAYAESEPEPRFVKCPVKFLEDQDWNEGEPIADRNPSIIYPPVFDKGEEIEIEGDMIAGPGPLMLAFAEEYAAARRAWLQKGQRGNLILPDHFRRPHERTWLAAA